MSIKSPSVMVLAPPNYGKPAPDNGNTIAWYRLNRRRRTWDVPQVWAGLDRHSPTTCCVELCLGDVILRVDEAWRAGRRSGRPMYELGVVKVDPANAECGTVHWQSDQIDETDGPMPTVIHLRAVSGYHNGVLGSSVKHTVSIDGQQLEITGPR